MAARKPVHTVPKGSGWANKAGGRTISNHRTKSAAQKAGRSTAKARKTEHVIHNRDGVIGQKNSYGPDRYPPKG